MNFTSQISGGALKLLRESQKLSAEQMAKIFDISRNTYLSLERAAIIPVKFSRLLPDALNLEVEELYDLLESLAEIHEKKKDESNENQTVNPKRINDFVFKNFQDNLGSKDRTINSLESANSQLSEKLHQEEFKNLNLSRDIDKLEFKFDNLRTEWDSHKKYLDKHIAEKVDGIDGKMKSLIEEALNQYSQELKNILQEEGSGLGDFFGKSGLKDLLANPGFASSIGRVIENAFTKNNDNSQNNANSGQGLNDNYANQGNPESNVDPNSMNDEQYQEFLMQQMHENSKKQQTGG